MAFGDSIAPLLFLFFFRAHEVACSWQAAQVEVQMRRSRRMVRGSIDVPVDDG